MIKPRRQLAVARWLYPSRVLQWVVDKGGNVVYQDFGGAGYFDISEPRFQSAIMMKLKMEYNITITQRKHHWEASDFQMTKQGPTTGSHTHPDIEELLCQVVEKLIGEGK
jgi:hypothetical protein